MSTDIGWGSTDQQAIDQYVLRPQRSLQYRYYHHSNEEDEESSSEEEGGNDFCLQTQDIFNAVYYISFREQIEIGLLHVHTPSISLLIVESMKFSLSLLSVHCNVSLLMIKLFCFWMIKSLSSQKMILFTFLKIIGKESHAQQSATKMNGLFKFSLHFNKKKQDLFFLCRSFFLLVNFSILSRSAANPPGFLSNNQQTKNHNTHPHRVLSLRWYKSTMMSAVKPLVLMIQSIKHGEDPRSCLSVLNSYQYNFESFHVTVCSTTTKAWIEWVWLLWWRGARLLLLLSLQQEKSNRGDVHLPPTPLLPDKHRDL